MSAEPRDDDEKVTAAFHFVGRNPANVSEAPSVNRFLARCVFFFSEDTNRRSRLAPAPRAPRPAHVRARRTRRDRLRAATLLRSRSDLRDG
jgi:hypothetical protein